MNQVCFEHKNKIQRICLHADCETRALCLLCDHPHGNPFQSIMVKKSQSYKIFETSINEALDKFVLQQKESTEEKVLSEQLSMIQKYFQEMRIQIISFLKELERTISLKLQSDQHQNFQQIKKARINRNYLRVDKKIFRILMEIYEGTPLSQIFKNSEGSKGEETYLYMKEFHDEMLQLLEKRSFKLKAKLPDIRKVYLENRSNVYNHEENYDLQQLNQKYKVKLIKQVQPEIDSILTDCQRRNNILFTTSYDKKLRIFDKNFNLKSEFQFSNILTKIHQIADDVFAIGHSKQIYIENIKMEKDEYRIENIMKLRGHTQKINDIHCLNSRIIGSSSSQSVKIWDLYKQKCEYTLTDQANPTTIRFLTPNNTLAVGFNNHFLKVYQIQTMKLIKKYNLNGVPLMINQGKFTQSLFYVGGFDSSLFIADLRLSKMASEYKLKQGAVTCIYDSLYDDNAVGVGDRDGNCNILDLRSQKVKVSWLAHQVKTNMSKPRGVLGIFENDQNMWTTVGCNDKTLKLWQVKPIQSGY